MVWRNNYRTIIEMKNNKKKKIKSKVIEMTPFYFDSYDELKTVLPTGGKSIANAKKKKSV